MLYAPTSSARGQNLAFLDTQFVLQTSDAVRITASQRTAIEYQMCVSIVEESTWLYKNMKYPRYKNFYGYAQVMSGAHVVRVVPLSFLNQEILHWRDVAFYINDTTLCSVKALGAAMTPPATGFAVNVKTRQRFTSVRFRLLPGIVANVSITWEIGDSACGNLVDEPDEKQGQPPLPANDAPSSNPRPAGQTGDELDPSDNDGNYNPNGTNPPPPGYQPPGGVASWKVIMMGYNYQDVAFNAVVDSGITDPTVSVQFYLQDNPGNFNVAGRLGKFVGVTAGGNSRLTEAAGWGVSLGTKFFG